ncbi:hypothetical protein [Streptomyces sp. NPDC003483]
MLKGRVSPEPAGYPRTQTVSPGIHTEADPQRALDAARASGAKQVIAGLPGRWEALRSKRFRGGQELSAGQWAKAAVARSLYKTAPVLLDEPTASMDPAPITPYTRRYCGTTRASIRSPC